MWFGVKISVIMTPIIMENMTPSTMDIMTPNIMDNMTPNIMITMTRDKTREVMDIMTKTSLIP